MDPSILYSHTLFNQKSKSTTNVRNHKRNINKLAVPHKTKNQCDEENVPISNIITKCDRLMKKVITGNRIGKVKKLSNKDYQNLIVKTDAYFSGKTSVL